RLFRRSASNSAIDCSSTPAAPWFAFTRLKASQTSRLGILNGFASSTGSSRHQMASVDQWPWLNNAAPSLQLHYRAFVTTTGCSVPVLRLGTLALAVGAACGLSLNIGEQVLTFHTKAWSSFAPPPCRMPPGQSQDIPQADPGGMTTPRFWHRLSRFRHVISGLLAFASLDHACRDHRPGVSATLTTTAFSRSSLRWLEIST